SFSRYSYHRYLPPFPTRRSSDLPNSKPFVAEPLSSSQAQIQGPPLPLARRLRVFDATMLVMGGTIGSGIFMNPALVARQIHTPRSEEHTSELQSRENLVCRLLLE